MCIYLSSQWHFELLCPIESVAEIEKMRKMMLSYAKMEREMSDFITISKDLLETVSEGFFFLHLHDIVEGLYFHSSLCVCVCLSVCVSRFLVNKIPAERIHRFGRGFR